MRRETDEFGKKIILALDLPDVETAKEMIFQTQDYIGTYKIGLGFLGVGGIDFARELVKAGLDVFLDMKLFDIRNTVKTAVERLADIGVSILTVHGDPYVVEAAKEGAARAGASGLDIYAVTFLTSLDMKDATEAGYKFGSVEELVMFRANVAARAGADGVIASVKETAALRDSFSTLKIITPGVRSAGSAAHDQKRVATPTEAFQAGADKIVVGREITEAKAPLQAAEGIYTEVKAVSG